MATASASWSSAIEFARVPRGTSCVGAALHSLLRGSELYGERHDIVQPKRIVFGAKNISKRGVAFSIAFHSERGRMKTALLHYWLTRMRGGENVLAELCRLYPEAEIFTHAYDPTSVDSIFSEHPVRETMIASLPGGRRHCQAYLPLMFHALKKLDLKGFDLIISSESGPAKGIRKPDSAAHVCYCHTPMRYLWDMFDDYYRSAGLLGKAGMLFFRNFLRKKDLESAKSVDAFLTNSEFVRERVRRIYGRDAVVVHPPVDCGYFHAAPKNKRDCYLFAGELVPYKRPDLALEACAKLKRRLVVAGDGPCFRMLKEKAGSNVEFVGRVSREEMRRLCGEARALLFPGVEDFGIIPVEAQAAGTPVVAYGVGGALETVLAGKTGLFFERGTADSLADAILEFERRSWSPEDCMANADRFSAESFRRKFKEAADRILNGQAEK